MLHSRIDPLERVGFWTREKVMEMNNRALARMALVHPEHPAASILIRSIPRVRKAIENEKNQERRRELVSRESPTIHRRFRDAKFSRGCFLLRKALAALKVDAPPPVSYRMTGRELLREVAEKHDLTVDEILSPRRVKRLCIARQEAAYRIIAETTLSYVQVGRIMCRDHTTILSAIVSHAKRSGLPDIRRNMVRAG